MTILNVTKDIQRLKLIGQLCQKLSNLIERGFSTCCEVDFCIRILAELVTKVDIAFPKLLDSGYSRFFDESVEEFRKLSAEIDSGTQREVIVMDELQVLEIIRPVKEVLLEVVFRNKRRLVKISYSTEYGFVASELYEDNPGDLIDDADTGPGYYPTTDQEFEEALYDWYLLSGHAIFD